MTATSNPLAMGTQLAASALRFGWFYGVSRLLDREARRLGQRPSYRPRRPVPSEQELMIGLASAFLADAEAVRRGDYPPMDITPGSLAGNVARVREAIADLADALDRRSAEVADSVRTEPAAAGLPDYYLQDFHFQTGGYLSDRSARLYDTQVEALFYGTANAMRRAALPAIAKEIKGRDQRRMALLDVACGTGRLLRQIRLAWPALQLTGLDLSPAYLAEASRHLAGLRPGRLIEANAEAIPLPDASQDVVTCVFLFHELPPEVRRTVSREIARVLKPGGLLVLVDSLQLGDKPGWDGLLEAFPVRFHEPYYRQYLIDDLDELLTSAGLRWEQHALAFLSKVVACRKPA